MGFAQLFDLKCVEYSATVNAATVEEEVGVERVYRDIAAARVLDPLLSYTSMYEYIMTVTIWLDLLLLQGSDS